MEKQPVLARCVLEILGAPKDFIEAKLREHVNKLREDGIDVVWEKYEVPKESGHLFSQFVELQVNFRGVEEFLDFCFDSMPSSVEILSPEVVQLDMKYFEGLVNDFQAKLHHTDMMLKTMQAQKHVLDKNAINILHNFIKFVCKTKPHSLSDLASLLGIGRDELTPFVSGLVDRKVLKKEGEVFLTNG